MDMGIQKLHNSPANLVDAADSNSGGNLSVATPSETGNYAVNYVTAHVKDSVNIEMLQSGKCNEGLKERQKDMHRQAGIFGKPVNLFTSKDLINLTNEIQRCSIGNCADLCMLAARIIAENGYPHPVELCGFKGKVTGYSLDHAFLLIHADHKKYENYVIDPLMQMLSHPDQHHLTRGTIQPKTFEEPDSFRYLFCYATNKATGVPKLLPISEISDLEILSVGQISLTQNRELQFIPTPV